MQSGSSVKSSGAPFSGFQNLVHRSLSLGFCFFFFGCVWVFVAARRLSLFAARGGYSSLRCSGFSWQWLLLLQSTACRRAGFSSCSMRASVVAVCRL